MPIVLWMVAIASLSECKPTLATENSTGAIPAAGILDLLDLPWWASERIRQIEDDRSFLETRLASLPPYSTQSKIRAGFHSRFVATPNQVQWVQVDLGREYSISQVTLVPTAVQLENALVEGFGFPIRFRVQVSNDAEFRDADLVADLTSADYPNPGRYPVQFPALEMRGRYVRITVTRQSTSSGRAFFALGELIVLAGNRNVAAWRPVQSSGSVEATTRWSQEYLVDEVSILPLPMGFFGTGSASHSHGFLSRPDDNATTRKWVQLDLGDKFVIDEIRLVPARPADQADIPGWGFPSRFRVEVANQPDLSDAVPYCDFTDVDFQHWTDRPLVIPAETREMFSQTGVEKRWSPSPKRYPSSPIEARYVRVTATKLDSRVEPRRLALAEVQVYSGNNNVAVQGKVTASDAATGSEKVLRNWAPRYLVDEYTSRTRLLEYPAWLDQLENRRTMELHLADLTRQLDEAVYEFWSQVGGSVATAVFVFIGLLTWVNWRQSTQLKTQTERLRTQIASDLHDDIGSNLGTIALLCQTLNSREKLPGDLKPALEEMREVALETSDAMRDILWLLRTPTSHLEEFVGRLRSTTSRLLAHCDISFQCPSELPETTIQLSWRRNVFLSFKEALHNAARHSQATKITVRLEVDDDQLVITITDNGRGFDFEKRSEGLGIGSITKRMKQLGGRVDFKTAPGEGTEVTLDAPFHQLRYIRQLLRRVRRNTNRPQSPRPTDPGISDS